MAKKTLADKKPELQSQKISPGLEALVLQYRSIIDSLKDAIHVIDLNFRIILINQTFKKWNTALGLEAEAEGCDLFEVFPFLSAAVRKEYHFVFSTGKTLTTEEKTTIGEKEIITETTKIPIFRDGKVKQILTVIKDIAERIRAEEFLKESQQRYKTLTENINVGIYRNTVGPSGRFIEANPAIIKMFGYQNKEEFFNVSVADLYQDPTDRKKFNSKMLQKGFVKNEELNLRKKDGTAFIGSVSTVAVKNDAGKVQYYDGIIEDISQRKNAEAALKESESKFRGLFNLSPQPIALTDFETAKIVDINDKFCELFKYKRKEIIGNTPTGLGLYSESNRKRFLEKLLSDKEVQGLEMDFKAKDGSTLMTLMFSRLVPIKGKLFILTIFHDVTERKRLENQFHQAQRMEAIGTLAGGVAHDFNNLLMGILGNVSLLYMDDVNTHTAKERLKHIEQYVKSGSELTKQLLAFARGGKYESKPTDLNEFVQQTATMFARTKKEINIHTKFDENIWTVEADQGQLEQVLLNLFVNAWQAMPGGGKLYLQTENIVIDNDYVKPFKVIAGNYVKVSVTDTGIGMDESIQQRIFEPFFTTKELGRGTGLGLASVYGIIKNHGGIINVYSEKGHGTTFTFYLPATGKAVVQEKSISDKILTGTETILLVDDEDMIIDVGAQMLSKLGYQVLIARSGKEAIALYKQKMNRIDLAVLDLVMPDMSGGELHDLLKKMNPTLKILLSSGYSIDGRATEILNRGCDGFIQKPFGLKALSHKIREILDAE